MSVALTPPEVAKILRVSADQVRELIELGQIRAYNTARKADGERPRWKIDPEAVEEFKASRAPVIAPKPIRRRKAVGIVRHFR